MMSMCAYRIKTILRERNIAVGDMCEAIGLSKELLSNMRKGRAPSCITLYKIAVYLDVSMDFLMGRTDNSNILY